MLHIALLIIGLGVCGSGVAVLFAKDMDTDSKLFGFSVLLVIGGLLMMPFFSNHSL